MRGVVPGATPIADPVASPQAAPEPRDSAAPPFVPANATFPGDDDATRTIGPVAGHAAPAGALLSAAADDDTITIVLGMLQTEYVPPWLREHLARELTAGADAGPSNTPAQDASKPSAAKAPDSASQVAHEALPWMRDFNAADPDRTITWAKSDDSPSHESDVSNVQSKRTWTATQRVTLVGVVTAAIAVVAFAITQLQFPASTDVTVSSAVPELSAPATQTPPIAEQVPNTAPVIPAEQAPAAPAAPARPAKTPGSAPQSARTEGVVAAMPSPPAAIVETARDRRPKDRPSRGEPKAEPPVAEEAEPEPVSPVRSGGTDRDSAPQAPSIVVDRAPAVQGESSGADKEPTTTAPEVAPPSPAPASPEPPGRDSQERYDAQDKKSIAAVAKPRGQTAPQPPQPALAPADEARSRAATRPEANWLAALRQEIEHCRPEAFLKRTICTERARWKYCAPDRWGTAPECPKARDVSGMPQSPYR